MFGGLDFGDEVVPDVEIEIGGPRARYYASNSHATAMYALAMPTDLRGQDHHHILWLAVDD